MKATTVLILSTVLFMTLALFTPAFAQSNQASYTVTMTYSTIQVTYPSQVMPGDSITVNVQVNPKSYVYIQTLTATIYYVDESGLHQIASETLVDNSNSYSYTYATNSFSKSFQVTVPQNISRTSLEVIFSETARSNNYNYFGYPYYFYYGYQDDNYSCNYWGCEYWNVYPFYFTYYPAYSSASIDSAIAPLSYIKATTPEYTALQSQYQSLQSQEQSLQQQLQQTQAQNQQLQSTLSQQSITINQLNQQLASANGNTQTYQALAVGFVILAAILAVFTVLRGRNQPQAAKAHTTEQKRNQ
jgi:hypothetical protein